MYNERLQKVWNDYLFIDQRYQEFKIMLKRSLNTEPTLYIAWSLTVVRVSIANIFV